MTIAEKISMLDIMRKNLYIIFLLFIFLSNPQPILAAKKLLYKPVAATAPKSNAISYSSARFRGDRKAVILTIQNLSKLKNADYTLLYTANNIDQGVQGSVIPQGDEIINRELLFGTCSKNVCTYHTNIKNMILTVNAQTKDGKTFVKRYKIKV